MGATKTEGYSVRNLALAVLAKAVGHPARVTIITYLAKVDSCSVKELMKKVPLSQPTISQHLRQLSDVGMVRGYYIRDRVHYTLNNKSVDLLRHYVESLDD